MRRHRTRRYRFFMVGSIAALAVSPLVLLWTRPRHGVVAEVPGVVDVYASGLNSLGVAAFVALPLAVVFLLWLWISNNALLFGAEVNAELERQRELEKDMD